MSENTFKLSNQEQAKFISYGATFAESELTADECIDSFAKAVGVKPSWELYDAGSTAWKEGYAKTKNIPFDSEAVRKAWSRFFIRYQRNSVLLSHKSLLNQHLRNQSNEERPKKNSMP